jgi:hypothetical protein
MTEQPRQQYYDHSSYTATYYALYIALEEWLASLLFKNTLSRVYLSSLEYAYRRRFELTDTSEDYATVASSSLQFPFANYWPLNSGWVPDKRVAANTASLLIKGLSAEHRNLRAMAVTTDVATVFHFDREDDARLAYERLLWQSYREQYMYTEVAWKGEVLDLPLNVKIRELQFNPKYSEQSWLDSNRIFTIVATITLRSYSLQPALDSDEEEYFSVTEHVLLDFMSEKGATVGLTLDSLFDYNPAISVSQLAAVTTGSSVEITWAVDTTLTSVQIAVSGIGTFTAEGSSNNIIIPGLTEGSTYSAIVTFIADVGASKTLPLEFTTEAGTSSGRALLVGTKW